MGFDVDENQRLDDAIHEAHEAVYAHVRRVVVSVRGDVPAPRAEPVTDEWWAEYERLQQAQADAVKERDDYVQRTYWRRG